MPPGKKRGGAMDGLFGAGHGWPEPKIASLGRSPEQPPSRRAHAAGGQDARRPAARQDLTCTNGVVEPPIVGPGPPWMAA